MPLTLAQARTRLLTDYLDDVQGTGSRWDPDSDGSRLDRHLKPALSTCLMDYAANGGDAFDEETEVTTSAATGSVALTSLTPLLIKAVRIEMTSDTKILIPAASPRASVVADRTARDCHVTFVRNLTFPTNASHYLVGTGATAANTWDAFDEWVVVRAAVLARQIEGEPLGTLETIEAMMRSSVLTRSNSPRSREPPRRPSGSLRWQYLPTTLKLVLV
jgi:hypothetical protein